MRRTCGYSIKIITLRSQVSCFFASVGVLHQDFSAVMASRMNRTTYFSIWMSCDDGEPVNSFIQEDDDDLEKRSRRYQRVA